MLQLSSSCRVADMRMSVLSTNLNDIVDRENVPVGKKLDLLARLYLKVMADESPGVTALTIWNWAWRRMRLLMRSQQ